VGTYEKILPKQDFLSVRPPGIEPGTFSLKGSCSTG
jgi:hypothetical protein